MQKTIDELYDLISDIKTKQEFKKEIKNKSEEYDNLIDDNIIALLIVDELGRNLQTISKISNLKEGQESTVIGKIVKINNQRKFNRKNGTTGKVVNLEIEDNSGRCGLVLWDKDVELVKYDKIKIGSNVKIINGYIKDGFNGIEINMGRWGLIEIETTETIDNNKNIISNEKTKTKGKIINIEPTRAFFKDDGEFGFVTKLNLETENTVKQITIWDEKVKEVQKLKNGDLIEIDNINIRTNSGTSEYHINSKSNIKKL